MALTNAEKQARHRTRRANKLARYEAALIAVRDAPTAMDGGSIAALRRIAANALATPTTQS